MTKKKAPTSRKGKAAPNKGKRYPAEAPEPEQINAILRKCSRRAPTGVRNRAMILVLWRCGLRLSEMLKLAPADIDLKRGVVHVKHGKSKPRTKAEVKAKAPKKVQRRQVGLPEDAAEAVERWMEVRKARNISGRSRLFTTLAGSEVNGNYLRIALPRLARRAGIEARIHPHCLRHAYARDAVRAGLDVRIVSAALGHADISITNRYVNHLDPRETIEATRSLPVLAEMKDKKKLDPVAERIAQLEAALAELKAMTAVTTD